LLSVISGKQFVLVIIIQERPMEIKGTLLFRNNHVYIWNGSHEISLFTWLASHGLKDKQVQIQVTKDGE